MKLPPLMKLPRMRPLAYDVVGQRTYKALTTEIYIRALL